MTYSEEEREEGEYHPLVLFLSLALEKEYPALLFSPHQQELIIRASSLNYLIFY